MAEDMFRPPINRSMLKLDRAFFKRTVPIRAARILNNKNIAKVRTQLARSKEIFHLERIINVRPDPEGSLAFAGRKCILLPPKTPSPTPVSDQLAAEGLLEIVPYDLDLDYDYWTYHDIISAILPEDDLGEIPSGFTQTGHVAHLNLRDDYLKYKYLIAEILLDKNSGVTTVINKINDVGDHSEYRTFQYEVLAGEDDMNVTVHHEGATFVFDFSKVYWNSRLSTEHRRLVALFKEGEAVCDVMAGIGPFAVPAGLKKIFVWANDLNPDSYSSMQAAIKRNKVERFVKPFNEDGHNFIQSAARQLLRDERSVDLLSRSSRKTVREASKVERTLQQPKTFQHYVMNLPATALSFLPDFIGLYAGLEDQLPPGTVMPTIHVYCFNTKSDDNVAEFQKICEEISDLLKHTMKLGEIDDGGVSIHDVRDVAPKKRMFCASFRLPEEVAFRTT